jgi:hypothetical protein
MRINSIQFNSIPSQLWQLVAVPSLNRLEANLLRTDAYTF